MCAPAAASRDRDATFPADELAALASRGWLGIRVDRVDGGGGWGAVPAAFAVAEFSRACASIGLLLGFHNFLVCGAVSGRGGGTVRASHLSALARGERLGAVALSDPAVPTPDAAPAQASFHGESYVLQGVKAFVPGAVGAGLFLVYAFCDERGARSPRERVVLLVPRETPGLSIDPPDPLVGVRASGTATVRFRDCRVPASHRLGGPEEGRGIAREILAGADLVVAAQAVGIATAAFEKAVARAREREASGSLVGGRQGVQFKLADMLTALETSRLFLRRAAGTPPESPGFAYAAAQAKSFAGRAAVRIADEAIEIRGGTGSLADYGIERHWRDAKTTELNPSTRETAQLLLARRLLEESR